MLVRIGLIVCVSLVVLRPANTAHAEIRFDEKGVTKSWPDANSRLRIGGRFHADLVRSPDDLFGDNEEIRRARLDASLRVGDHWRFKVDREFSSGRSGWRNLWARYSKGDWRVTGGQFVTPFSQEEIAESNNLAFIERSLPSVLAPSFRSGVALTHRKKRWSLTGAVMANPINNASSSDDGVSFVARGVVNPIRSKKNNEVVHLAAAVEHRVLDDDASLRLRSRHEVSLRDRRRLSNDRVFDANSYTNLNFEAAYMREALLVSGQVMTREARTDTGMRSSAGGYAQASYLFGDARRNYSRRLGAFGAVIPENKYGALEASARFSHLRLGDLDADAGDETAVTLGLSWFINRNLRLSVNSTYSDIDNVAQNRDRSGLSHQARFQVAF